MKTIEALLVPLTLMAALHMSAASATNLNGQYDDSAYAVWFDRQYNKHGGECCQLADAHRYDGAYTMNPDGTVTLPLTVDGNTYSIVIEAFKVLDGTLLQMSDGALGGGPNPTGHPVVWSSSEQLAIDASNIYCFSPGELG